jgi:hypothetical protein
LGVAEVLDEPVDCQQQNLGLRLLVTDVLNDQLHVAEPLRGVGITRLLGRLHLRDEPRDRLRDSLKLALELLVLLIDRLRIHAPMMTAAA